MRQNPCDYSFFCQIVKELLRYNGTMARYDFRLYFCTSAAQSNLALGFWAMAGLFCACFFLIHLFRWAAAYFLAYKRGAKRHIPPPAPPQKPPEKKPRPAEKQPEKIYYIVEKKNGKVRNTPSRKNSASSNFVFPAGRQPRFRRVASLRQSFYVALTSAVSRA